MNNSHTSSFSLIGSLRSSTLKPNPVHRLFDTHHNGSYLQLKDYMYVQVCAFLWKPIPKIVRALYLCAQITWAITFNLSKTKDLWVCSHWITDLYKPFKVESCLFNHFQDETIKHCSVQHSALDAAKTHLNNCFWYINLVLTELIKICCHSFIGQTTVKNW